jgi:protein gp37
MADLFGAWVPDSWIKAVFDACAAASWHNYIFLTKNPERYTKLVEIGIIPDVDNIWLGSTATTEDAMFWWSDWHNTLVSIEPIHGPFDRVDNPVKKADWVIIGAESGSRKGKVVPERKWIENILVNCRETGTPVFMKDSLSGIWGEPLVQEFPAALQRNIA